MQNGLGRLQGTTTVRDVCEALEEILGELRANGYVSRLPPEFHAIAARNSAEVHQWCEVLGRSSAIRSGSSDSYFILFDTARLRIEYLRKIGKDHAEYVVHLTKSGLLPEFTFAPRRVYSLDEAVRACISLRDGGYRILKVRVPSGNYVLGTEIERATRIGRSTLKVALMMR